MKIHFRLLTLLFLVCILACHIGCSTDTETTPYTRRTTEEDAYAKVVTVRVDGNAVEEWEARVYPAGESYDYARLSILDTVRHLGVSAERSGQRYVRLTYNGKVFYLDVRDGKFEEGRIHGDNWLIPAPGSTDFYCEPTGEDVITDSNTLSCLLHFLGVSVSMECNYEEGVVSFRHT